MAAQSEKLIFRIPFETRSTFPTIVSSDSSNTFEDIPNGWWRRAHSVKGATDRLDEDALPFATTSGDMGEVLSFRLNSPRKLPVLLAGVAAANLEPVKRNTPDRRRELAS